MAKNIARNNDSIGNTLLVIIVLCLLCSIVVAGAAVGLKGKQEQQRLLDKQSRILQVSGLLQPGLSADAMQQLYNQHIVPRLLDLQGGELIDQPAASFDMSAALKDPTQSRALSPNEDPAGIRRVANLAEVYLVKDPQGKISQVVLPVRGNGLWSMMYAFIAVGTDGNTVKGLTYYQHGETPGLGGEIENPNWQRQWVGRQLFDEAGNPAIRIVQGGARADDVSGVDGLSGATLTANGVQRTMDFWLGENGYGPFLKRVREGVLNNG